jgi:NADH:ubiquinone oxidoreductase subunit K
MLLFVLAAAAAEVAVGLALVVRLHRHDETLDADLLRTE